MNNKIIIIICIIVILFVAVSGYILIKNAYSQKEIGCFTPLPQVPIEESSSGSTEIEDETVTIEDAVNIVYLSQENAILNTMDVSKYVVKGHDILEDKTIDGVTYKDINSANIIDADTENDLVNAEVLNDGNNYVSISEDYTIDANLKYDNLFTNDKELLPSRLYLVDESINAFYNYNGNNYYIPIEKVENAEDERIEYRDSKLVIMKNSGKVSAFGKDIATSYTVGESGKPEEDFSTLFSYYFLQNPSMDDYYKVFEISSLIEGRDTIMYTAFDKQKKDSTATNISRVFLTDIDGAVSKSIAPIGIAGNVQAFKNVFYDGFLSEQRGITSISQDYLPTSYYIFVDNHFEKVFRFINGDHLIEFGEELTEKTLKTIKDYPYKAYEIDGAYNKENEFGEAYVKYKFSNDGDDVLPKGTDFKIIQMLNSNGNAIIQSLKDGSYFIIDGRI